MRIGRLARLAVFCAAGLAVSGWSDTVSAAERGVSKIAAAKREAREEDPRERKRSVEEVQRCLAATGYYNGPINGKMTKNTWTAFWFFKHEHGLKAHSDPFTAKVSEKLFSLCKVEDDRQAALKSAPSLAAPEVEAAPAAPELAPEAAPAAPPAVPPVALAQPVDCLLPDLAALLGKAQRRKIDAPACAVPCLPKPEGIPQEDLDRIAEEQNAAWCENCLALSASLPFADIMKLEHASGVAVCVKPQEKAATLRREKPISIAARGLWRGLPLGARNEKAVAVVIANSNYPDAAAAEARAQADADAVLTLLVEHLRYDQENVIELRNATTADFERVFGKIDPAEGQKPAGELAELLKGGKDVPVTVYYAGRGALAPETGEALLAPIDVGRNREVELGFPVSLLQQRLNALPTKSALILLEAGFSTSSGPIIAPNLPLFEAHFLPKEAGREVTIISAATGDQRTLRDPESGLGLFTRYLVEALAGRADLAPIGNGDHDVDVAELYVYTAQFTRRAAARSLGLMQAPAIVPQVESRVFSALEEGAR